MLSECSNFILDTACRKLLLCCEYLAEYFRGCSLSGCFRSFKVLKRFPVGLKKLTLCLFMLFSPPQIKIQQVFKVLGFDSLPLLSVKIVLLLLCL